MPADLTPELRAVLAQAAARGSGSAKAVLDAADAKLQVQAKLEAAQARRQTRPKPGLSQASPDEFTIQVAFFDRIAGDPAVRDQVIYAVPNFSGHYGSRASRLQAGARAKRSGRRRGIPDVNVDVARAGYHGLRLEFKTESGGLGPEQKTWHDRLRANGYAVVLVRSAEEAWAILTDYLAGIAPPAPVGRRKKEPARDL